ncbi:long-chain fatty acid--CoA ligase [Corallococcus sp. AB030]|uniref:AMP-binding protein n=1 Tax=unclassified Corallococcus TaxID=2685029 RepID=UPI000EA1E4B7|nr:MULTISPECIES: AMP-binding protein [unclassified Corallococcus]RKH22706.1 long-chain fatty acid--CoA ligase [Corallococcus sp. CA041A]RKI13499.1 long-chain fatty acid--CoA ligase [Corallococcus sp. AB030]
MPFDVKDILRQLEAGFAPDSGAPKWWQESWEDPEGFAVALAEAHAGRGVPPPKSRPGQQYDFFHDLIVRHVALERPAFRTHQRIQGWQALAYRTLHDLASRRASEWADQGVEPGAKVCLVHGVGQELLVSLLATLKLGGCFTLLPPMGPRAMATRLESLTPDFIAAEPHQLPLLKGHEQLLLKSQGRGAPGFTSHTYKPSDVVGLLFSPLVDPPHTPVPLTAENAWKGAIGDGMLTFGLSPGDLLAAPDFPVLQHLPALLFATLLRGATYLHLEMADLALNPAPLLEHPLRALGVTPKLRDLLVRHRASLRNVQHWFRSPEEPFDAQAWRAWVKQCGLQAVPSSNILIDASAGGAVLASSRGVSEATTDVHTDVFPVPGRAWTLKDPNQSGQGAPTDVGVFTLLPDKEYPPGHVLLARIRQRYHYAGTLGFRHDGRTYSAKEVTAALEGLPFLAGTSVVPVSTGGLASHSRFLLLAFTGATPAPSSGEQEINRRIEMLLGGDFLPDRIEFFPLFPHRVKGAVDDAWCASQFFTGALHKKAKDPMFQALTALRGRVLESSAASGEDDPSPAR